NHRRQSRFRRLGPGRFGCWALFPLDRVASLFTCRFFVHGFQVATFSYMIIPLDLCRLGWRNRCSDPISMSGRQSAKLRKISKRDYELRSRVILRTHPYLVFNLVALTEIIYCLIFEVWVRPAG